LTCAGRAVKLAAPISDDNDSLQQSSQIWYGARALADWIRAGGRPQRIVRAHALRLRWHAHWFEQNWQAQTRRLELLPPAHSPVFILGLWRSGTTVLHELLAGCTGWSTPRTWQCFHPPTCFLTGAPRKAAEVERPMDAGRIHTHGPQEDEFALLLLGEPSVYRGFIDPRRLADCAALLRAWDSGDPGSAANALPRWQQFLRGIAAQGDQPLPAAPLTGAHGPDPEPSGRPTAGGQASAEPRPPGAGLLLKSPNHCFRLPLLRAQFPDARFVWIGRHSGEVLSSNLRMWRAMTQLHGLWDCPSGAIEAFLLEALRACGRVLERTLDELPPERLCWLDFEQLRTEPERALRRTLEFLGAHPLQQAHSLQHVLSRVPIHPGNRATLPEDADVQRLEALMASARQRFGDPVKTRRTLAG
jgi:omega-hydroxy-beta-dihydromenaquinone-9 sulfotransferase